MRVREVMQPRAEIDLVTTADDHETVIERAIETGRTRLPLVEPEQGLDGALGVVNAKDLLAVALRRRTPELTELARPLPRIAEGVRIDELLREMRRERNHVALVVDEHGTVVGLVTLKDVIEQLVGEIDDEFDAVPERLLWREGERVHVAGGAPVRLVARELGIDLPAPHEATISGLVIERLGRVPAEGETVALDGVALRVLARDDTRVEEAVVGPLERAGD